MMQRVVTRTRHTETSQSQRQRRANTQSLICDGWRITPWMGRVVDGLVGGHSRFHTALTILMPGGRRTSRRARATCTSTCTLSTGEPNTLRSSHHPSMSSPSALVTVPRGVSACAPSVSRDGRSLWALPPCFCKGYVVSVLAQILRQEAANQIVARAMRRR